jgi:putative ABC transport system permease protein
MISNVVRLALQALSRNVMRSSLTMLGVIIGVAAVVTVVTLGAGASAMIEDTVASLGDRLLFVSPSSGRGPGQNRSGSRAFTLRDVTTLSSQVDGMLAVSPTANSTVTAVYGNRNWRVSVTGITDQYFPARSASVIRGTEFDASHYRGGKLSCILGKTVREELFGSADPVGAVIRIGKSTCPVIGELESKGQSGIGNDQDNVILAPLRAVQNRLRGKQDIGSIAISVAPWASMDDVKDNVTVLFRERRNIQGEDPEDFQVQDMTQIAGAITDVMGILTLFLGAIAGVSLLVGGIGIMNIMLVSVTERTREIGIRLAIGAMESEVLLQFLVESVILTTIGGAIGVLLGLTASFAATSAFDFPFIINPTMVVVAFVFSALIGIVFGFLPARRAASLDPIEALRHE